MGLFLHSAGEYTLNIYQGSDISSATPIHTDQVTLSATNTWEYIPIHGGLALNTSQDLWVTFSTDGVSYPASYVDAPNGTINGQYIYNNGEWVSMVSVSSNYDVAWRIQAITSASAPALSCAINGPTQAQADAPVSFEAVEPTTVSLYPNPTSDVARITASSTIRSLQVTNALGQVVMTRHNLNATDIELNTSGMEPGLYIVSLLTDSGTAVQCLAVVR